MYVYILFSSFLKEIIVSFVRSLMNLGLLPFSLLSVLTEGGLRHPVGPLLGTNEDALTVVKPSFTRNVHLRPRGTKQPFGCETKRIVCEVDGYRRFYIKLV